MKGGLLDPRVLGANPRMAVGTGVTRGLAEPDGITGTLGLGPKGAKGPRGPEVGQESW